MRPTSGTRNPRAAGERVLDVLLVAAVAVPPLAIAWGREDGRVAFVLYREPKLVAAAILGWILLAAFYWTKRGELRALGLSDALSRAVKGPAMTALALFVGYLAATGLWVRVRENYFYELNQYALLVVMLITLRIWARLDATAAAKVRYGLVGSLAAVTAIGALQAAGALPWLAPIDPEIGVSHPSLMGYKNPAALAILGQIFLLAHLAFAGRRTRTRLAWGALLAGELVYLATLESRTSYAALVVALVFLAVLRVAREPSQARIARTLGATAAALAVAVAAVAVYPPTRDRARSIGDYLARPRTYLESDRGTYLLNTLNMVRYHPAGVGLGDWQTYYPVYRRYHRSVAFDDRHQVRRAHSDHVQFLGEAGWPGLAFWLAFLAILVAGTARRYLRTVNDAALFAAAQLVAFVTAMATDYLVEMPYHKFQFFLVVFLALDAGATSAEPGRRALPEARRSAATLAAVGVTVTALLQIGYHASLARKVHVAAAMESLYLRAVERPGGDPLELAWVLDKGRELTRLAGCTKTLQRSYLVLAQSAHLLGRRDAALAAAREALELHPYDPEALRLVSNLTDDPAAARRFREAYHYVMDRAIRGFEREYPKIEP